MIESDLLRHIRRQTRDLTARWPQVLVGPGDDCAAVGLDPSQSISLLTVDHLVEGRHFASGTPIDLIARKAVARSISDIAAMAGAPQWSLATGLLPKDYPHARELTDALHRWAAHWSAPLVGGDLATSPAGTPLVLTVTIGGRPHTHRGPVLRSGAKPGDELWMTGSLGGSLASGRHLTFEPRIADAQWLCDTLGDNLHAMIDLSDGLGRDAARMADMSGVRFEIDASALPLHRGICDLLAALGDGEDYELCFAAAPSTLNAKSTATGTPLTRIGRAVAGQGCIALIDGRTVDICTLGWDHGQ